VKWAICSSVMSLSGTLIFGDTMPAAGVVIGIVPAGLVTGYSGNVMIDSSNAAAVHFEDAAPADIVSGAGVPAVPVKSAFQTDMTILRVRGDCAWVVHPGGQPRSRQRAARSDLRPVQRGVRYARHERA
jgi:hypothetical protein